MAGVRVKILAVVALAAVASGVALWLLVAFEKPVPVEELLSAEAAIDVDDYDGSAPPGAGASSVLVLGTPHFAQADYEFAESKFDRLNDVLAAYEPDLVAVEHLPPDWRTGRGGDYRPDFDLDAYAATWNLSKQQSPALLARAGDLDSDDPDPCQVGRAYFLTRDLANAHYWWATHDCPELKADEDIREWAESRAASEHARIGYPVARASGIDQLVSIDYRGEDAEWFLYREALTSQALLSPGDLWRMLPTVSPTQRQSQAHFEAHTDSLADLMGYLNSPQHIGLQYWTYEQQLPKIETRDAGQRQRDNYWRRNERMFEVLDETAQQQRASRILVVVGAGHKYFLDELARDAGYRWIDPREYLTPAE